MSEHFFETIRGINRADKKNLVLMAISLFFVLFSYPITRSTTEAIFLQSQGAKNSPVVWLYSVLGLTLVIFLFNKFQRFFKKHKRQTKEVNSRYN